jgi:hypothetical protein
VWIKANFVVGRMPKLTNGPVLQLGELLSPKQYPCEVVFMLTVYNRITLQVASRLASGQVSRRSQGTLLPSSGEPKVSNPWNKCVMQELIY